MNAVAQAAAQPMPVFLSVGFTSCTPPISRPFGPQQTIDFGNAELHVRRSRNLVRERGVRGKVELLRVAKGLDLNGKETRRALPASSRRPLYSADPLPKAFQLPPPQARRDILRFT